MKAKVWQPERMCVCLLCVRETWIEEIGRIGGPDQRESGHVGNCCAENKMHEFQSKNDIIEVEVLVKSFLYMEHNVLSLK